MYTHIYIYILSVGTATTRRVNVTFSFNPLITLTYNSNKLSLKTLNSVYPR